MRHYIIVLVLAATCCSCKKTSTNSPNPAAPAATISTLNCSAATVSGTATTGNAFSGTITIPYTGGNARSYSAGDPLPSVGVTGLTATLQAGTLANGNGSFTYTITGTPSAAGTATFEVTFGSKYCTAGVQVGEAPLVQYGTPYANVTAPQDATIYQINIRAFSAQSNLQGVTARLDSIKALGVNVVYLMPIYPVGTVKSVNSPYCVQNYTTVNPEFGSLSDLRTLVATAHTKGMSVMLDWVANHTAWDNPWTTQHKDWYQQNASGDIISPPGTGWNDVAQLNFNNTAMRLEMIRSMKYWVYTANVDGFRCDYADGPPFSFWQQAIDSLRNITTHKLLLLAEGNRSDHYAAGFDFIFGFSFYGAIKSIYGSSQPATNIDGINSSEYNGASANQQVVRYITNHDVNGSDGTPQDLFGGVRGSISAFVIAAYMKSVPMIYNGQEVALPYRLTFPFTGADITWGINPEITAEYKKIIGFRNTSAAIRRGQLTSYTTADVCAFTKAQGAEKVFVACNVRNSTISYTLPAGVANSTWTNAMTGAAVSTTSSLTLQPYAYVVLKK